MSNVIVAVDSFKGSLGSAELGDAFRIGWLSRRPYDTVDVLALADGGEGTVAALAAATGCSVVDGEALADDGSMVIIEAAATIGLAGLPAAARNPEHRSSMPLGQRIAAHIAAGRRRFIIGLGGTATNDGGAGMLQALGFTLLDKDRLPVPTCGNPLLGGVSAIVPPTVLPELDITVLTDVDNPLVGPRGATAVFAPQKGADADAVARLEAAMQRYAEAAATSGYPDMSCMPGAGAAGGLGGAFMAVLGARRRSGAEAVLDAADFDSRLARADLVITGEGRLDCQTLMGKAPVAVMRRAQAADVPVVAVAGQADDGIDFCAAGFAAVELLQYPPFDIAEAMMPAVCWRRMTEAARRLAANFSPGTLL